MEKKEKRKEYVIKIGLLLKNALEKQKERIRDATYNVVPASDYEAGEILAKKIIANNLV